MPIGGASTSGGSSAGDVRAGGAFVEIYGKDKLTKQLDGLRNSAKSQVMGLGRIVGGFALADVAKTVGEAAIGMEKFTASMEEGARISQRIADSQAAMRDRIFEKVGGKIAMPVEVIPPGADRVRFLEQRLSETSKNLATVGQSADKANAKVTELFGSMANKFIEQLPFAGAGLNADRSQAKAEADDLNARRKALQDLEKGLRDQIAAQKKVGPFTEWATSADELEKSLDFAYKTLGMTNTEAAIFRLEMEAAAKGLQGAGSQIESIKGKLQSVADKDALLKTKKAFGDFDKDLEFRLRTYGMSAEQIQIEKMKADAGGFGSVSEENAARRSGLIGLLRHMENLDAMAAEEADRLKADADARSRMRGSTAGGFGIDSRSIGTIGQFNRIEDLPSKIDESNTWLGRIFGAVSEDKPKPPDVMRGQPNPAIDRALKGQPSANAPGPVNDLTNGNRFDIPNPPQAKDLIREPEIRVNIPSLTIPQPQVTAPKSSSNNDLKQGFDRLERVGLSQVNVLQQIQASGPLTFR